MALLQERLDAIRRGFEKQAPPEALEVSNGEPSWTLPVPGTYVIDTGGTIRYASAAADYTRRPEPDESLAALEAR